MRSPLELQVLRDTLVHISYDGWDMAVYQGVHHGPRFRMTKELPDNTRPGETVTIDIRSRLDPFYEVEEFVFWVYRRVVEMETHEVREKFRYRGEMIYNPHHPLAGRDEHAATGVVAGKEAEKDGGSSEDEDHQP